MPGMKKPATRAGFFAGTSNPCGLLDLAFLVQDVLAHDRSYFRNSIFPGVFFLFLSVV
jgi:hypothetical protein